MGGDCDGDGLAKRVGFWGSLSVSTHAVVRTDDTPRPTTMYCCSASSVGNPQGTTSPGGLLVVARERAPPHAPCPRLQQGNAAASPNTCCVWHRSDGRKRASSVIEEERASQTGGSVSRQCAWVGTVVRSQLQSTGQKWGCRGCVRKTLRGGREPGVRPEKQRLSRQMCHDVMARAVETQV